MREIIGTGLSGLVGSRIVELNPDIKFVDISIESGVSILDLIALEKVFADNPDAETVLHLAAFTDTTAAWAQNGDKDGSCYEINVLGTRNIADLCRKHNKYLIYISTDFVFDGTKEGKYTEADIPNPIEWYGQTKYLAEKVVLDSGIPVAVVRLAFPYRANFVAKVDLVRKIIFKLQNNEVTNMFSDQITTPTFIDNIALGLRQIINKQSTDIYHLVGSSSQSPYDMAKLIAATFSLNSNLVKPLSLQNYLQTPNVRPYAVNLGLSNQKFISEFGYTPKNLTEGLQELKQQLFPLLSPRN